MINNKSILNFNGKVVEMEWLKIKEKRYNVDLDEFIIMPNHFQGIVIIREKINDNKNENIVNADKTGKANITKRKFKGNYFSEISPKPGSLAAIIRSFKSSVSKIILENGFKEFKWQSRFYDRIIRTERELINIRHYIRSNPLKWEYDKNVNKNLTML